MKKFLGIFMLLGLMIFLAACSGDDEGQAIAERNTNVATGVVEIVDLFLDNSITADEAQTRVRDLPGFEEGGTDDSAIGLFRQMLQISLDSSAWSDTPENREYVLEDRNRLATELGLPLR